MSIEFFSSRGNPRAISSIGDSRVKGQFTDLAATAITKSIQDPLNVANALLGQRIITAYNGGISGFRSDEYFSADLNWRGTTDNNLAASLEANALWWLLFGFCNDISQGYTAAQIIAGYNGVIGANDAIDRAILLGKQVILFTEPGSTSFNAAKIAEVHKINRWMIEKASSSRAIHIFDYASAVWDHTNFTGSIVFKSGYSSDGTHLLTAGSWAVGTLLAAFLDKLIPPQQFNVVGAP
jgi:hypothetical protein